MTKKKSVTETENLQLTITKSKTWDKIILIKSRQRPSNNRYCLLIWVWAIRDVM